MSTLLKNKLFISTRPSGQSDELNRLLQAEGAETMDFPLIEIRPAKLSVQEKELLSEPDRFQWLILTSPNGVRSFFQILKEQEIDFLPEDLQVAVIGKATEKVLTSYGYSAAFVNPGNTGEDFAEAFIQQIKDTQRPQILLALGNLARSVIQDALRDFAECTRVNVYETVSSGSPDSKMIQLIQNLAYEMLIFTSPSAVQSFIRQIPGIPAENVRMACIGEITAREARKQGFRPLVVAEDASARGIVDSIIQFYS